MSGIRRTHPGYFNVTVGLALPWYTGLGIGFTCFHGLAASARAYSVITEYVPLQTWGIVYLALGLTLLASLLVPRVPHAFVRVCCGRQVRNHFPGRFFPPVPPFPLKLL